MSASRTMATTKKKPKRSRKNTTAPAPEAAEAPAGGEVSPQQQQLILTLQTLLQQAQAGNIVGIIGVVVQPSMQGASTVAGNVTPASVSLQLNMLQQQVTQVAINALQQPNKIV